MNFILVPIALLCFSSPASAWTLSENGVSRPLLLEGAGNVRSVDLPDALQSAMRVDALARTVEWHGDRGWLRAAADERLVVKTGGPRQRSALVVLPRPVQFLESAVLFPEELLKFFPDIFSFVEMAAGEEGEVLKVGAPPEPPASLSEPPSPNLHSAAIPQRGRGIRTVVIDPGHGGSDPGAKGHAGAVEKDIVLAVGLELARALRERDPSLKIILTRSRDEFVSLPDRAKLANTGKGDLFVSIHANSVRRNKDAGGFEVYHLDIEGANDEARAVAAFENAEPADRKVPADRASGSADLTRILGALIQLQYIDASMEFSKQVSDHLSAALEGASKFRGSKGAFFYVLKDVMSPAVLIEIGFVTNEWEASFLQKPWYQRKIAAGIVEGILQFKTAEETRLNPGAPASTTGGE